jgi:hypothetical protein
MPEEEKASRQPHTQETTKLTKTQMETSRVSPREKKRQKTSEADSFRNIKVIISYTLEDGHVRPKHVV